MIKHSSLVYAWVVALLSGCGSSDSESKNPQNPEPGAWTFEAEPGTDGKSSVFLRIDRVDQNRAFIDVVAQKIPKIQGVAFRLGFEPKSVSVEKSVASTVWSHPFASEFAKRSEGELWAGIGHVGPRELPAADETVLARLEVVLEGSGPVAFEFKEKKNLVIDSTGKRTDAEWLGGTFVRKN